MMCRLHYLLENDEGKTSSILLPIDVSVMMCISYYICNFINTMAVNFVCLLLDYHIFREPPTDRKEIVENQVLESTFIFSYSVCLK